MIAQEVREKIKSHLGSHYMVRVKERLQKLGITNRNGNAYDEASISHVMNQRRSTAPIVAVLTSIYNEILEKTDYSQYDRKGYLAIFERTQEVAFQFVRKLLTDKADNTGLFCGFLSFLEESKIGVSPVKAMESCNGYFVSITMGSQF